MNENGTAVALQIDRDLQSFSFAKTYFILKFKNYTLFILFSIKYFKNTLL